MEFRNPALKKGLENCQTLDNDQVCTRFGVFGKTLILLLVAIFTGMISTVLLHKGLDGNDDALGALIIVSIIAAILALISSIVAIVSVRMCKVFSIIYAASEGILLGGLTALADLLYPGIGVTALILTFGVSIGIGVLYFTGIIKANKKLFAFIFSALIGFLLISIVALICNAFHFYLISDFFFGETSVVAWGLSILMTVIAALSLVFDFDYAASLIESGADVKYEWTAAHGLAVGIIYLYIRILELLIRIMASKSRN